MVVQDAGDLSVEVKTKPVGVETGFLVGTVAGSMINSERLTQIRGLPEMQLYPHDERRHLLA